MSKAILILLFQESTTLTAFFINLLVIFMSSFEKYLISLSIFNQFIFLQLSCLSSLYTLDIIKWMVCNIFSLPVDWFFTM